MGVPKFYRWISERYPCLSEIVKENQIPEFDNLYLDMNGIIHTCSHPNDDDPHFRITEEQIFRDIFRYLEVLFRIIRPRKVFFMAVDGVAPRAKMNQQRGRRFMSARTAEELIEQAKRKGEKLPSAERFDSNCITPGTVFMAKLQEQLKYFVNMKITHDEMWQGIRIYLSGHDVPGEGEHKIMDFIRYERSQPGYDQNTRHCLYGLDADLIMLGMCSHEPYFALLREEVKFVRSSKKGAQRTGNAEQTTFHLLHLTLLRDYLELEFGSVKENLPFDFDLESIIDDWLLMGFLVGNDFIPHLPNLHIHANALPQLYKAYKKALPELGGYINERGYLNLPRFEKFMLALSQFDRDYFLEEFSDYDWLESKKKITGGAKFGSRDIRENVQRIIYKGGIKELVPYTDSEPDALANSSTSNPEDLSNSRGFTTRKSADSGDSDDIENLPSELQDLIRRSEANIKTSSTSEEDDSDVKKSASIPLVDYDAYGEEGEEEDEDEENNSAVVGIYDEEDESWSPSMEKKFKEFKSEYYGSKMHFPHITTEVLHDQAVQYVRAIQWNLHYYYNGICSWSWFYPYHYAPYLSDVKGFSNLKFTFELGEPFFPFQQLLAVLPAASKKLLPIAYQSLMIDSASPLIDFYPKVFETDLNGKKNDWEAVILIPFIDEARLLKAMDPVSSGLTDEEKSRNKPGKHLLYTTAAQDQGFYRTPLMGIFPDLEHNKAMCAQLPPAIFRLPPQNIRKGLLPGVRMDMYFLGFSTLKHLPHTGELQHIGVKVFEQSSKNESVFVTLLEDPKNNLPLSELASRLLGKEVYINWPHLCAGKVGAVAIKGEKYVRAKDSNEIVRTELGTKEMRAWNDQAEDIKTIYATTRAVDIGDVKVLLYIYRLLGRKYVCSQKGDIKLDKQWGELQTPYAMQTIVENVNVRDSVLFEKFANVDDLFPVGTKVFVISNPFYGCEGVVEGKFDREKSRFRVYINVQAEPDFSKLIANQERIGLYWYPGWQAAQKLEISGHFLSRITGTVYVVENPSSTNSANSSGSSGGNKQNIGLNLKFSKKNEEVPDYTKRDADGVWLYSSKVLKIMDEYYTKFPEVCKFVQGQEGGKDFYNVDDIWKPSESKQRLKELLDWLKSLPCHGAQHQSTGTETVDERVIRAMESAVEKTRAKHLIDTKLAAIRPNALFRACLSDGHAAPDSRADYELFDRVVCAREGYTVPVGLRGTVVGIHQGRQEGDLKLSVLFDEEFIGGVNIRNEKTNGYHIMSAALINLSYGARLVERKNAQTQQSQQRQQPVASEERRHGQFEERKTTNQGRGRMPMAIQTAMATAQAQGGVKVLTKSAHSTGTQRLDNKAESTEHRPQLHKSMSESHTTKTYGNTLQGGKSIMNEIFPNRIGETSGAKAGGTVFVNSNIKKDNTKKVEESSRALRSLLHVGGAKESESTKKKSESSGKTPRTPRDEHHQSRHQIQQNQHFSNTTPKTPQSEPRVPFTARQPQPPPFAPMFSPDVTPVAPPPLQSQQQQAKTEQTTWQQIQHSHQQQQIKASGSNSVAQMIQQTGAMSLTGQNLVRPAPISQVQESATTMITSQPPLPSALERQQRIMQLVQQATIMPPMNPLAAQTTFNPMLIPTPNPVMTLEQQRQFHFQQQHLQQLHQHQMRQQQMQQQQQLQQLQQQQMQQQQFHHHQQQQQQQMLPQQFNHHHQQQQQMAMRQQPQQQNARENNMPGRQRRTSNNSGATSGHDQFVPMQVTKKQPAPAYVKNIAAKAVVETEKTVENRDNGQFISIASTEQGTSNSSQGTGSGKSTKPAGPGQQKSGGGNSTRPKSRLAIKLGQTPQN